MKRSGTACLEEQPFGLDERPAVRDLKPQAKRSSNEVLIKRSDH